MSPICPRWYAQLTLTALLVLSAALPASAQRSRSRGSSDSSPPAVTDALHLYIQVIQVEAASSNGPVEVPKDAPTTDEIIAFAQQARQNGQARERYAFDVPLVVNRAIDIVDGVKAPYVSRTGRTDSGQVVKQTNYDDTGCRISVNTQWADPCARDLLLAAFDFSISELDLDAGIKTDTLTAPVTSKLQFEWTSLTRLDDTIAVRRTNNHPDTGGAVTTVILARFTSDAATHERQR